MNIIITGASRGIGASATRSFCLMGDHRIFVVSRNEERLNELKNECSQLNKGSEVIPVVADLARASELEIAVEKILGISGTIDILINNAGLAIRKPFEEIDPGEIEAMLNINFLAPAKLIRLLLPALEAAENPHIVNIGSMAGYQGSVKFPGLSFYGATKGALALITEILSVEFADKGIAVNCLALGAVNTEMLEEVFPGFKAPLDANDMADYIADFALSAHNYIRGKVIPVTLTTP